MSQWTAAGAGEAGDDGFAVDEEPGDSIMARRLGGKKWKAAPNFAEGAGRAKSPELAEEGPQMRLL